MHRNCLYEKYVWEIPVRVTHWVNFLAIVALSVTGFYIGAPESLGDTASDFVMGWVRFVHFVAGYAFAISVISRIYWAFAGNRYASWREFIPFATAQGRSKMAETLKYYLFINKKAPHTVGHNSLATTAYMGVLCVFTVMIVTGFALYGQRAPQSLIAKATGWLFGIFSAQGMRLTHHLGMWLLIAFAIHHVYSCWLMDIKERGGVMSSIFGGYKAVKTRD